MPITKGFTMYQVNQYMIQHRDRYEAALLQILEQAGIDTLRYMRSLNTFTDQTGNLRNSEGYMIYKNGSPIYDNYPNDKDGVKEGAKIGATVGKSLAEEVAAEYAPQKGFLLVVTAGMNYALYVESKGYDVITGGSKNAVKFIKNRVKRLHDKTSKTK